MSPRNLGKNFTDLYAFQINGYTLIAQEAQCSSHAGLAIFIKQNLKYEVLDICKKSNIWEGLFVQVESPKLSKKVIVGNIYRPPREHNENYQFFMNQLNPILTKLNNPNQEFILTGDFNINLLKVHQRPIIGEFFDSLTSKGIYPHITLPTRLAEKSGSLIDNFFCKFSTVMEDITARILISGISDHFPYCLSIRNTCTHKIKIKSSKFVYINRLNDDNLAKFKAEVQSQDLESQISHKTSSDPNKNYETIQNIIQDAKDKHISRKKVKYKKRKHKKEPWVTKGIIISITRRDKLYKDLKKTQRNSLEHKHKKINLRTLNVILKRSIFIAKKTYYFNLFKKYSNNIKNTWAAIRDILAKKNVNVTPSKVKIGNILYEDPIDIANGFNNYFINIGNNNINQNNMSNTLHTNYLRIQHNCKFNFSFVTREEVAKVIASLKPKSSSGVDEISTFLIRFIKDEIADPLTKTINQSISTGIFPTNMKIAKVIPLFKKHDPSLLSNYRPISLLPALSRVFEKILCNQITEYFNLNNLFHEAQYGFRKNHNRTSSFTSYR